MTTADPIDGAAWPTDMQPVLVDVLPNMTETDPSALERERNAVQSALVWQRAHREVAIARVAQVACPWLVGALIFGAVMYATVRTAWRDGYRQAQVEQAGRAHFNQENP